MSTITLDNGYTIRDQVFNTSSRFCWNPNCNYLVGMMRSACGKCGWTDKGPLAMTSENPTKRAKTMALKTIADREAEMNKTERKYKAYLETLKAAGEILFYRFEAIKVRLGNNCFWTPDFLVVDKEGFVELHDSKAFWKSKGRVHIEDDARVKMVVTASEEFPVFTVVAVWEQDGKWHKKTM
jgi:ribosomal protein S27AE